MPGGTAPAMPGAFNTFVTIHSYNARHAIPGERQLMPLREDLQRSLYRMFDQAQKQGVASVRITATELYRRTVRMKPEVPHVVISSAVMRSAAKTGDAVVQEHADDVAIRYR